MQARGPVRGWVLSGSPFAATLAADEVNNRYSVDVSEAVDPTPGIRLRAGFRVTALADIDACPAAASRLGRRVQPRAVRLAGRAGAGGGRRRRRRAVTEERVRRVRARIAAPQESRRGVAGRRGRGV